MDKKRKPVRETEGSSLGAAVGPRESNFFRPELDDLDRAILDGLELEGRITHRELAARLGVAASTIHSRVQRLTRLKVILGYRALVRDPQRRDLEALIHIQLRSDAANDVERFMGWACRISSVQSAFVIAGRWDCLLHVAVANSAELRTMVMQELGDNPEVVDTNTQLVFLSVPHPRAAVIDL